MVKPSNRIIIPNGIAALALIILISVTEFLFSCFSAEICIVVENKERKCKFFGFEMSQINVADGSKFEYIRFFRNSQQKTMLFPVPYLASKVGITYKSYFKIN